MTNTLIGQQSGETNAIRVLCKLLAGEYKPEQYDKVYAKYPQLKEINNQVIDFLQLYNDNVDSLTEPWEEDELRKYYDSFVAKQGQIEKYKAVNEPTEEEEEVSFASNIDEIEDEDDGISVNSSLDSSSELDALDLDVEDNAGDDDIEEVPFDEVETAPKATKTTKKATLKKVAVAAGVQDDFELDDISDSSDISDDLEDDDFTMGEDDFEDLL